MKKKIYISGKITDLNLNEAKQNFKEAQKHLEELNFDVVNPLLLDHKLEATWEEYMRIDIKAMLDCKFIFVLKGYQESVGAMLEIELAKKLDFTIIYQEYADALYEKAKSKNKLPKKYNKYRYNLHYKARKDGDILDTKNRCFKCPPISISNCGMV